MQQYLFLYPLQQYFDRAIRENASFRIYGYKPEKLFAIIDERYRNEGFGIDWLFFGKEGSVETPDRESASSHLVMHPQDRLLTSGITMRDHQTERPEGYLYPDPEFILGQLPPHNRLVLGGFHQADCVDRIAEFSHKKGIPTFVDEDTTDHFFMLGPFHNIPIIRTRWTLDALGCPPEYIQEVIEDRKNKPWLVQC